MSMLRSDGLLPRMKPLSDKRSTIVSVLDKNHVALNLVSSSILIKQSKPYAMQLKVLSAMLV